MGYLLLDTRVPGQAGLSWGTDRFVAWQVEGVPSGFLALIRERREMLARALEGVLVASGPGRFSALRVGVLYAHLLARWFRVPLFEAFPEDLADDASRARLLASVRSGQRLPAAIVFPRYDREPNITLPRL